MFLSCWTSSVINKAGGSVPERVVLYCIVIENGYFPSDQLEQYHIVHLEVPFLHFKVFLEKNRGLPRSRPMVLFALNFLFYNTGTPAQGLLSPPSTSSFAKCVKK